MDHLTQQVLLKEFNVPMLMNKNQLMSINNFSRIHWSVKSKIKNEYKKLLSDWFLDGTKIPENSHIVWTPTYRDKRRRDAINLAAIAKIIEDSLVDTGSLEDDNNTTHTIYPGSVNTKLVNHMLNIKIYGDKNIF